MVVSWQGSSLHPLHPLTKGAAWAPIPEGLQPPIWGSGGSAFLWGPGFLTRRLAGAGVLDGFEIE